MHAGQVWARAEYVSELERCSASDLRARPVRSCLMTDASTTMNTYTWMCSSRRTRLLVRRLTR
jgi:hypothetical protein